MMKAKKNVFFLLVLAVLCFSATPGHAFLSDLANGLSQGTLGNKSLFGGGESNKGFIGQMFKAETNVGPIYDYYLGREVAARVMGGSKALPAGDAASLYVNTVCRSLVLASDSPYQYRPYTCIVLEDRELNAFAAPGGIIFITSGMLSFLQNEDELAAVLGHEISHVQFRHGAVSVAQQNVQNVLGKNFYGTDKKNSLFGSILGQLYGNILNGYSIEMEAEADANGMQMAYDAGYSPQVFPEVLERFKSVKNGYGGAGYPEDRARLAREVLKKMNASFKAPSNTRTARYKTAVAKL